MTKRKKSDAVITEENLRFCDKLDINLSEDINQVTIRQSSSRPLIHFSRTATSRMLPENMSTTTEHVVSL
jgi:hypothetical protein